MDASVEAATTFAARAHAWTTEAMADLLSLTFPVDCAGCDLPGQSLCAACRDQLAPQVTVRRHDGMPVASGLAFGGVCARALRAVKTGQTSLVRSLAPALRAAADHVCAPGDALVVPVPTSAAAMRRRGYRVADLLATRAGLAPVRALRIVRTTADQRHLGREERADNVAGSMRAAPAVAGRTVLIVDDVVTTGATLAEASRALRAAGAQVLGAATVAATLRRKG